MHPVNKNLYGFGSSFLFEVLDSKTGNVLVSKQFPEMKAQFKNGFNAFLNCIQDDGLYFTNLFGENKFGKLNIRSHTIEFVSDIDVKGDLLSPSFPHKNCYFALDYNDNLHVIRPFIK